jgi:DegV family protein with EDD domain
MGTRVAVVTDSTAHLHPDVAAELGIAVVPLHVVVDGRSLVEGSEIGPDEVADALRRHVPVSTSRPSPRAFLDVYESAAANGAQAVVSVHISGSLSGTADAARLATRDAPVPVSVVDSRTLGMGLGFAVQTAAEAVARGLEADEVVAAALDRAGRSATFFYVDTLEHLRRGGRVGAASAMVGTALAIKPLLHVVDGSIEPLEKVRTRSRAMTRLVDLVAERAGAGRVDIAVQHLAEEARAQELADRLAERVPGVVDLVIAEVGAVVAAHVGPGVLGVVVSPR